MKKTDMEMMSEKTEFGPGKTPLYYNNRGLFSDPFLEERLPNLEEYYNSPSTRFLNDYWNIDESDSTKFNRAFQDIMDLWDKLGQDVEKFCANERQLQNRWIDKIFEYLGWTIELEETVSRHGKTNFPDYGLYKNFDDLAKSKDCKNTFKKALAVADAKAWGINLDGKGFSNKNPSFQIINYLKQTDKTWGVLTDGQYWRIYSVRSESKHTTFYEIDLIKILSTGDYERFKYFYNFFRVEAFEPLAKLNDRCFLDFVFEDGKHYAQRVDQNLNDKVYGVVDSICHGFLANYKDPSEEELKEVYEYSMYYLFKLMFVLNCESKGLLEVNKQDDYYESSLRKKCMEIKDQFENGKKWSQQPRTYNYINDLFELLKHGDESIGVHGFGEEPFEIGSTEFYEGNKITDEQLNHALLDLACDYDDEDNLQFIDYKILSPDHIGSLFEGLLEFNLLKKGKKIELVNTKGDRKATGSYYTPEHLVDYIVEETISSLLKNMNPKEILGLNILDPSMGSGHFLLGVVKYLEKHIVELQSSDKEVKGAIEFDQIKKEVLRNCVFGIDINPLATQLAKFSLWIYTSEKGDFLEPLSDQLICSNSLLSNSIDNEDFLEYIHHGNVDVIIGNPPYIGEKGNKDIFQELREDSRMGEFYERRMDIFYFFFHLGLDLLKEGGRLSYITTNYYITSTGGNKLRDDLKDRSVITRMINFNEMKVFKSAMGQHSLVTMLEKRKPLKSDRTELYFSKEKGILTKNFLDKEDSLYLSHTFNSKTMQYNELYKGRENYINVNFEDYELDSVLDKLDSNMYLKDYVKISQGIVTGADKISPKHIKKYPEEEYEKGEGIFALTKKEVLSKGLSKDKTIKPWFKNSNIRKYSVDEKPESYVLYLKDSGEKQKISKVVKDHFKRFEQLLIDRLTVCKKNKFQWNIVSKWLDRGEYYLMFYPRKQEVFESEKIVVPQRSKSNRFGYTSKPWYAASDVFFITNTDENDAVSLKAMSAYLNSKVVYTWLYFKGKRKGDNLELVVKPLSEIPFVNFNQSDVKKLERLVDTLSKKPDDDRSNKELNDTIYKAIGLNQKEIKLVEEFYTSKHSATVDKKVA